MNLDLIRIPLSLFIWACGTHRKLALGIVMDFPSVAHLLLRPKISFIRWLAGKVMINKTTSIKFNQ